LDGDIQKDMLMKTENIGIGGGCFSFRFEPYTLDGWKDFAMKINDCSYLMK